MAKLYCLSSLNAHITVTSLHAYTVKYNKEGGDSGISPYLLQIFLCVCVGGASSFCHIGKKKKKKAYKVFF